MTAASTKPAAAALHPIPDWVIGHVETPVGAVPRVSTRLRWRDHRDAVAARWAIGRNRRALPPGLYAIGQPTPASPLLATANYKLSFDALRAAMDGCDAWLLVLDTKGINVWCAAGKGTLGTDEVIHRMDETGVARLIPNGTLILPQLAAPGVAAHDVRRRTGFRVLYGPVRATDVPAFLSNGCRATDAMRRVTFDLRDRLAVVPVEVVHRLLPALFISLLLGLLAGVKRGGCRWAAEDWSRVAWVVGTNFLAGMVLTPALLPLLPGRAFALKGAAMGALTGGALWSLGRYGLMEGAGVGLLSLAACSYLGLMFTGSTPYTSASGVRHEIRRALPAQLATTLTGPGLWMLARWR